MAMKVALAADHGGFVLKTGLVPWLEDAGYLVLDLGARVFNAEDDYPDLAEALGEALISGRAERGILVCGSGVGAVIAANKIPGIRACLCHDTYSAHQGVEHDNMNVLCLGGRIIGLELARELAGAFLRASPDPAERFIRRLDKVAKIEARYLKTSGV